MKQFSATTRIRTAAATTTVSPPASDARSHVRLSGVRRCGSIVIMRRTLRGAAVFMAFGAASCGGAYATDSGSGGADAASIDDGGSVTDGGDVAVDGGGGDGGGELDAPSCFGPAGWSVCPTIMPTRTFVPPATIDTETSSECLTSIPTSWSSGGQPDACIITARTISITSAVTVTGRLPLVLVATDSITVAAKLEVASHRGGVVGPGANASDCDTYTTAPQPSNVAGFAGGGAGASFGSIGGEGGPGNGTATNRGLPTAASTSRPATLRGGCRGQNGGNGLSAGGVGGDGGGAVYLVAGGSIALMPSGSINASGAGATGGSKYSGGGGGGSGGLIALHASAISASAGAVLIANGGGGSSGVDGNNTAGADGNEASTTTPTSTAKGGTLGGNGNGGNGFAGTTPASAGFGASAVGGGGGGGGAGFIVSNKPLTGAAVSPAAVVW